ncbi:MAG: glycosyltransferase family 2 protein [Gammaproteobacteria bacterium]
MKVSVITVCYNSSRTILDTIESVKLQDHDDIEYIVIDGSSNDGTLEILKQNAEHIDKLVSEPDEGLYDAMNKGILLSSGDVIAILNSDDVYENDHVISDAIKTFTSDSTLDLVFGDVVFVKNDDLTIITRHYRAGHFKPWKLRFGWMPPHTATFVKKSGYEQAGLYSINYKIAADFEMFVRLLIVKKLKFKYLHKTLVRMRVGGVSTSGIRSNIVTALENVKACRENGIYTNLFFVLTKVPFKLLEFKLY